MTKAKMKSKNGKTSKVFIISIFAYPTILFFIFYVYINLNSFAMAFEKRMLNLDTTFAGLANFTEFINRITSQASLLKISTINSLQTYAFSQFICLPLIILFSYVLYKKCFIHKTIRFVVMLPTIISGFVNVLMFQRFVEGAFPLLFSQLLNIPIENMPALLTDPNNIYGTTLFFSIWMGLAGALIVYPNAMNGIPEEIMESSQIDGVDNMFQELRYMILPLIFPTISTFLIVGIAGIFTASNSLMEFYLFYAPPEPYNVGYYFLVQTMTGSTTLDYPVLAAGGLILTIIVAPLTFLVKYLLEKFGPEVEI